MAEKWIKKKTHEVNIGDIWIKNNEWSAMGLAKDSRHPKNIELNGWHDDEEFVVSTIRTDADYCAADRPWVIYDDEENSFGENYEKQDKFWTHIGNVLFLSDESKRERTISKLLT